VPGFWLKRGLFAWLLLPLSALYYIVTAARRFLYRAGKFSITKLPVPVVVVGNITAGGSGKTPLVIALVHLLKEHGIQAGVVSRGYRGTHDGSPLLLDASTTAELAGDEPVLISEHTGAPVCIGTYRVQAAELLLREKPVDVVICDDGLQHYALARDLEVAVVNTDSMHGNGWLLPSGPLREPVSRLDKVDFVVHNRRPGDLPETKKSENQNDYSYNLQTIALCRLAQINGAGEIDQIDCLADDVLPRVAEVFSGERMIAMPGIANPRRFFEFLSSLQLDFEERPKPDHHVFVEADFDDDQAHYLVTEKDKVKCKALAIDQHRVWYTKTNTTLSAALEKALLERLQDIINKAG